MTCPRVCRRVLCEAWLESGELRAWLTQEHGWLDGLQRRLRRSPHAPADAEEICDELYELESYVQNHGDSRLARIRDLGRQLADAHIMPEWIRAEVAGAERRWGALRAQAEARAALLERAARDAAHSELALDKLQQWVERAQRAHSSAPLHELETQRELMREVEAQVQEYKATGKQEAAARLREQLDLVQVLTALYPLKYQLIYITILYPQ